VFCGGQPEELVAPLQLHLRALGMLMRSKADRQTDLDHESSTAVMRAVSRLLEPTSAFSKLRCFQTGSPWLLWSTALCGGCGFQACMGAGHHTSLLYPSPERGCYIYDCQSGSNIVVSACQYDRCTLSVSMNAAGTSPCSEICVHQTDQKTGPSRWRWMAILITSAARSRGRGEGGCAPSSAPTPCQA
jgi:hypothetical protein